MAAQLNAEISESINVLLSSLVEDVESALLLITQETLQPNLN